MGRPPKYTTSKDRLEARRNQCRINQRAWRARAAAVKVEDRSVSPSSTGSSKQGSPSSNITSEDLRQALTKRIANDPDQEKSDISTPSLSTTNSYSGTSSMHTPIANIADWRTQLPLIHARDFAPSQYDIPVLLPQPSPAHHISLHELRQIDYYRRVMIGRLDGACPSQLWTKVVLPASFSEPAIMHALVAFAGLHEEGEKDVQKALPSSERASTSTNEASGRKPRSAFELGQINNCLLYTSPSPRD